MKSLEEIRDMLKSGCQPVDAINELNKLKGIYILTVSFASKI